MAVQKTVGSRVYDLRNELNMSQIKFAEYCKLSRTAISNIENDCHSISSESLDKIAKACHISVDYLLYGDSYSASERVECMLESDRLYMERFLKLKPEQKKNMMRMLETFYPEVC